MWLVAVALGLCSFARCARFPRATKGDGFLKIPVGTVDRPARKVKRDESPLVTVLENMDFFYATDSKLHQFVRIGACRLSSTTLTGTENC